MRYYWLRDRENQRKFKLRWERGSGKDYDYFKKYHAKPHHSNILSWYVKDIESHVVSYIVN